MTDKDDAIAATSVITFSSSASLRDAVQALAPESVPAIDAFQRDIQTLDLTKLRLLDRHAMTLPEVEIYTPLNTDVVDTLVRMEIGDREVADQRGHEKEVAKIQARGPMWAEVVKIVGGAIVGIILTLIAQKVM